MNSNIHLQSHCPVQTDMQINIDKTETRTLLINLMTQLSKWTPVKPIQRPSPFGCCYRELFTDDVIRTEGIRVELSQLATKHLKMPSN